jgi:hypothetical protein
MLNWKFASSLLARIGFYSEVLCFFMCLLLFELFKEETSETDFSKTKFSIVLLSKFGLSLISFPSFGIFSFILAIVVAFGCNFEKTSPYPLLMRFPLKPCSVRFFSSSCSLALFVCSKSLIPLIA